MDPVSPLKPLTGERLQALLLAVGAPDSSKKRTRDRIESDNEAYMSPEDDIEDEDIPVPSRKRVSDSPSHYSCKHCSKSFKRRSDRERHERTHTGERPYKCKYCQKGFIQSSALSNHERIHTGDKPFVCDIGGCSKSFSDSSSVARHRKSHADRPRHVCEYCPGKSYARRDALERHLAKFHAPSVQSESPQ